MFCGFSNTKPESYYQINRIDGKSNISDMMTKNVHFQTTDMYLEMMNMNFKEGRAGIAQQATAPRAEGGGRRD